MARIQANGIILEYEALGPEDGDPVLIITGLGGQIGVGPRYLGEEVVARGHRVIAFDNRDSGLSTKFDSAGPPDWAAIASALAAGRAVPVPYTLNEMARDAACLLDALKIGHAHIVGASMGGMIAQLVAIDYPEHTSSLTLIMTTSGAPDLPPPRPEVLAFMTPDPLEAEAALERKLNLFKVVGSPAFPTDESVLRDQFIKEAARSNYPVGLARQQAAIAATGSRRDRLKLIKAPTVVLHGSDDPIFPVEHARDLAANIPGAELRIVAGMGHDFPHALTGVFADAISAAASRAR